MNLKVLGLLGRTKNTAEILSIVLRFSAVAKDLCAIFHQARHAELVRASDLDPSLLLPRKLFERDTKGLFAPESRSSLGDMKVGMIDLALGVGKDY
jgi:hypothetical protein